MIEFKNLQNRFFIHQALMAAAAANVTLNTNNLDSNLTKSEESESLEMNTSSSSAYTTVSSVSSSPIHQHSPQSTQTNHSSTYSRKRKLNESDMPDTYGNTKRQHNNNINNNNKSTASFLISDILGLDPSPQSFANSTRLKSNDELGLYQQYQASLQQQYYAILTNYLIANSAKLNNSFSQQQQQQQNVSKFSTSHNQNQIHTLNPQPKFEVSPIPRVGPTPGQPSSAESGKKCANGILSSLEQLTKSQFQDDFEIASCLSDAKRLPAASSSSVSHKTGKRDDENRNSSCSKLGSSVGIGNKSAEQRPKSELPAWVFCTRYSDRPSAGPRHRKKAAKTTNSGVSTSSCNNSAIKKTVLSNTVVKTNAYSPNSSVSYSPHMTDKKLPIKPKQAFDYDTENDSKPFGDEFNYNGDEELCYDSDDSNMSSSKRPRTAFTSSQLHRLKIEFENCKYLTGEKRQYLADELKLNESQIKIWFQNKRAKIKKSSGTRNGLAAQLMAQGLYNHGSNKDD